MLILNIKYSKKSIWLQYIFMLKKSHGLLFCNRAVVSLSVAFVEFNVNSLLFSSYKLFYPFFLLFVKQSCIGYCVYHVVSYAQNVNGVLRNSSPLCLCWHPEWSSEISWWRDSFRHPEDLSSRPPATDTRPYGCSASGRALFWLWAWNIVTLPLNTVNVTHRRLSHSTPVL